MITPTHPSEKVQQTNPEGTHYVYSDSASELLGT